MSSLRHAVKRRTHKERSQPAERRKFGLLEKKKDYVLRARDFHKKEEALKVLRKKAANRNPDEFYFAMQKQRTVDGVHNANQDESNKYTQDELHLMKTQAVKYVAMKASMEACDGAGENARDARETTDIDRLARASARGCRTAASAAWSEASA